MDRKKKEPSPDTPLGVMIRMIVVLLFSLGLFIGLLKFGPGFTKRFEDSVDRSNPLGFFVLLVFSVAVQSLLWSLPATIPASIVRSYSRCIGAWVQYSLCITLSVLAATLFGTAASRLMGVDAARPIFVGESGGLSFANEILNLILRLGVVEFFLMEGHSLVKSIIVLAVYLFYILLFSIYLNRLYLEKKAVNVFLSFALLLIVTFLLSFAFSCFNTILPKEWTDSHLFVRTWDFSTQVSAENLMRVGITWLGSVFCVVMLHTISSDAKDKRVQMVAPVFSRPDSE